MTPLKTSDDDSIFIKEVEIGLKEIEERNTIPLDEVFQIIRTGGNDFRKLSHPFPIFTKRTIALNYAHDNFRNNQ